jgi:hypothetical protein
MGKTFDALEDSAQAVATTLSECSPTAILARIFVVLPLSKLPADDRRFAADLVGQDGSLNDRTPVLSLVGTAGREPQWGDRRQSTHHRAIPLLGNAFVRGVPMIAKLLADLDVTFSALEDGRALDTRRLAGGKNAAFFVADARSTKDSEGRQVIPSRDFVDAYGVRTVFGMGGAYVDGTLAVSIVFTSEVIERSVIDRFPSLISNFKMITSDSLSRDRVYRDSDVAPTLRSAAAPGGKRV